MKSFLTTYKNSLVENSNLVRRFVEGSCQLYMGRWMKYIIWIFPYEDLHAPRRMARI